MPTIFSRGNVLIPQASYKRLGLEKGQRYEVLATDSHSNGLMLRGHSGAALQVDPAQIRRKSVYEVEEMEIAVGDRLRWTRNDHALGRRNGQEFEVVGLEDGQVMIRWGAGGRWGVSRVRSWRIWIMRWSALPMQPRASRRSG